MSLSRTAFACSLLAALGGSGCGGSSSETPPPLKPDLLVKQAPEMADGGVTSADGGRAESGESRREAPSTWGAGAPSPSSKRFPEAE